MTRAEEIAEILKTVPSMQMAEELYDLRRLSTQVRNENTRYRTYLDNVECMLAELKDPDPEKEIVARPGDEVKNVFLEVLGESEGAVASSLLREKVEQRLGYKLTQATGYYLHRLVDEKYVSKEGTSRRAMFYRLVRATPQPV